MKLSNLLGSNAFWVVNKQIAKIFKCNDTAILLADLISKSEYFEDKNQLVDGYFFNTSENIENDCNISYFQQKKCIKKLIDAGFLEVKKIGLPARLHFKIIENKILSFLNVSFQETSKLDLEKLELNKNKDTSNIEEDENNIYNPDFENSDNTKINFDKLIIFLNQQTGSKFKFANDAVKKKYLARLKEGYTKDDIMNAIKNAVKNQFHIDNNFQHLTPEFFSRAVTLDKYSNVNNKPKEKNVKKSLIPKGVSYSGPQY